MENNLLTIQEAAKMLGIRPVTLRKWDREGKLRAIRIGSRADRKYRISDLENFMSPQKTKDLPKKLQWQEYIRSGVTWHKLSPILDCMSNGLKKHFGRGSKYLMIYFEHDNMYYYYEADDLYKVGRNITDKLIADKKFQETFFKLWDKKSQDLLGFIEENRNDKLKEKNDKELAQIYKTYTEKNLDWYGITISIDATDESLMVDLTKGVKKILKETLKENYSETEFTRVYNILASPSHLSDLNEERKLTLQLAQSLRSGLGKESKAAEEKTQEIIKKFWWTGLGWAKEKAKTTEDIFNEIDELNKSKINIEQELTKIAEYDKRISAQQKEVLAKYPIASDTNLIENLKLSDKLAEYHDYRKEVQMKCTFWEFRVLEEIAKRKNFPENLLYWAEPKEILPFLVNNKIDEYELNQRASRFIYLDIDGKISKYSGKQAERKHIENLGFNLEETRDLQGLSASQGTVIGKAFVAVSPQAALQIPEGDILVTGMTTPEYVPSLKKAAAIVTDEGGMTCHAAIISRELGIPCIVGTKYATKTIKTGDRIEVRANHGTVRILSPNQENKEQKREWFVIQERGDNIPLNPGIQPLFEEYTTLSKKYLSEQPHHALLIFHHGGGKYYPDINEWKKAEEIVLEKVKKKPNYMQELLDEYKRGIPKLTEVDQEIKNQDLEKLSNQEFWNLFDKYYRTYKEIYPPCEAVQFWLSQPLTDYLDEYLRDILRKRHQEKLFGEYFEILITPPEIPFTTKEERALLDIALEIAKNPKLSDVFKEKTIADILNELKKYPKIDHLLDAHKENFEWVPFDYGNPTWDKTHFVQEIANMLKKDFDIEKRITTIDNYFSNIDQKQQKLYQELEIDSHHQQLFRALQIDANTIDFKKESLTQSNFVAKLMTEEIGRRFDISKDYLMRLGYEDVKKLLIENQSPDMEKLKKRWEQTVVYLYDGKSLVLEGKEAEEFLAKQGLTQQELEETKEVKGVTASGGRAIGTAKIITSPKEFDKIETGDILITFMTTPEYVPILRKAAAIVTNEGGITCHAAIVSRELNIPCVVGTKNATQVFKDGDKVEVRANHGIVRKLEG